MKLVIPLPPEMEPFKADLEYFVSTMVRKLHTNRHKGSASDLNPANMLMLAERETEEAWKALKKEGQFEFAVECVDIANFALLAARGAWYMTRENYENGRSGLGDYSPRKLQTTTKAIDMAVIAYNDSKNMGNAIKAALPHLEYK